MNNRAQTFLIWTITLLMLAPWLYVQGQAMLNGNVTWLLIAADRMIQGQELVKTIYETNPPLSILLYAPHILFSKLFHLPPEIGPLLFTGLLLILSLLTSANILSRFEFLNKTERQTLLIAQTATLTTLTAFYFMDREHLMLMALIPFLLCQFALTQKIALPRTLLWPVMILGALAILVKPQYGILPTLFILYRMVEHRTLRVLTHADFLALSITTTIYLFLILTVFNNYIEIILPDVVDYYLPGANKPQTMRLFLPHFGIYLALFVLELFMNDLEKSKKRLLLFLYSCALLALIPLLVQMKGFYNHLLPAFGLLIMAFSLTVFFRLERWSGKGAAMLPVLAPIVILGLTGQIIKPAWNFPKGYEVNKMPVARFLHENCPKPCTFFAFHGDIETMPTTAFYTGYTFGTRFPSYWFLPQFLYQMEAHEENRPATLSLEKLEGTKEKYSLFAAQDLEYFKPGLLMIGTNIDPQGKGDFFDYISFFSENETFKKIFTENYEKTETFEFDRAEYFRGTSLSQSLILTYDVYRRKDRAKPHKEPESPSPPETGLKTNNHDPM